MKRVAIKIACGARPRVPEKVLEYFEFLKVLLPKKVVEILKIVCEYILYSVCLYRAHKGHNLLNTNIR
jgi:hypothetical protein